MDARRPLSEDPIAAWLEMLERRRGPALAPLLVFGLGATLALLPFMFYAFGTGVTWFAWLCGGEPENPLTDPGTWSTALSCLGGGAAFALFVLLALVPLGQASLTARFVSSFRKARTLEEVVSTPLTARRLVDALAFHGVRSTVRSLAAPVALCAALVVPVADQGLSWEWVLTPLAVAGSWYYGCLAGTAWERAGKRGGPGVATMVVGCLFVVLPLIALATLFGVVATLADFASGLVATVLACLPLALVHRELAIQGIDENSSVRRMLARWSSSSARRGSPYQSSTSNAMLFRERAARSGGVAQRLLRVHAPALAALAFAAWLSQVSADESAFVAVLPFLTLYAVLQTLYSSAMGLYHERQQGTLDLLQQSGLTVREYVNGCVRAAADKGMVDVGLVALVAGVSVLLAGQEQAMVVLLPMTLVALLAIEAAAHWGTSMAADCKKKPQPAVVAVTFGTAVGIGFGLAAMLGFMLGLPAAMLMGAGEAFLALFSGFLTLASLVVGLVFVRQAARTSAMNTLRQRGDVIGFVD